MSYALMSGWHWLHVTIGFGCGWAVSVAWGCPTVPPGATRFASREHANVAIRLARINRPYVICLADEPNVPQYVTESLDYQAELIRRFEPETAEAREDEAA